MNIKSISVLLIALMCSQLTHASWINSSSDLGRESIALAYQLNQFVEPNKSDICAGDVAIASAYIESSGLEWQRGHYSKALTSISYGLYELKEIIFSRSYCANLSNDVKPYLAKAILIQSQMEQMPATSLSETSNWASKVGVF